MLWESGSDSKENPDERGWGPDKNPLHPTVTPVLVPAQSGAKTTQERVPVLVPDVEELKEQFQQQQNMLTQIKQTIKENESQLSSKGKKVEAYANRLSQIRARTKNNDGKIGTIPRKAATSPVKTLTKKSSKENLAKESDEPEKDKTAPSNVKLSPKGKITELKKRLQESKIKFEERTGKEVSETKKIESIVENLRMQLDERDVTIQELQKIVEQPPIPSMKCDTSLRKSKGRAEGRTIASKSTQTVRHEQNDESIEIIALQNRIYELEANILDLEESLKEKESVIDARTQAVTLLSQDLSIKGKNTLECLEETRQEMRSMQNNFIIIENQLKKELVEKDDELNSTEEKLKRLESVNSELNSINIDLKEKLAEMEKKYVDLENDKKFLNQSIVHVQNDDKVTELNNRIIILNKELDDSNKSMIKMKLEHKNKIKSLNKIIEKLKEDSDDKAEILRLQNLVDEFEVVKESLQNKIAELEEEKVTEKELKDKINELEAQIRHQASVIENHLQTISNVEKEKFDMFQSTQDQNILIENLYAKIQNLESESVEKDLRMKALEDEHKIKFGNVNFENDREVESTESFYSVKLTGGDRKEFEEYKITNELNNVQVEEQIEMLIREKQQLLDKLKSLSGVSSTESFTFETVEHSEFHVQKESKPSEAEPEDQGAKNQDLRLERVIDEQQTIINDLQNAIKNEKEKVTEYQQKIGKLEEAFNNLEQANNQLKRENVDESDASKTPKSNVNVKNKIKKIQSELMESRKTIQLQNEKLEELNVKLEEKEQLIKNYIEKIELFEKDDWGRENDWKTTQDEFEHLQELQKKCLSLENSLIELTEDCERLRKENIEVVHLLSEEKVKRKKLMERFHVEDCGNLTGLELSESKPGWFDENDEILRKEETLANEMEGRVLHLAEAAEVLENKLKELEERQSHPLQIDQSELELIKELQEKLEWSNIVLTSKETEIFKLQSLLEDNAKMIEDLERNLKETHEKFENKEIQLRELSLNFVNLQESLNLENKKTSSSETQLIHLKETVRDMEADAAKKDNYLKELHGALAEKNLEIEGLKQDLAKLSTDLTNSYKNMGHLEKCLRDKEEEYKMLLGQKNELEDYNRKLVLVNEDMNRRNAELTSRNEVLQKSLENKEKAVEELTAKLKEAASREPSEGSEELKLKVKKLAANLKKKVQNEKDLLQQLKENEEFLVEKEKILNDLHKNFTEVKEKWATEKSEKEQFKNELATIISLKSSADSENADLKERLKFLESEFNNAKQKDEYKLQQMETQLQKMYENSERMKLRQEQDREIITNMEAELTSANAGRKENEELKKVLAETCGKYEEFKFKFEESNREKLKADEELGQLKDQVENLRTENTCQQVKIQEQLAFIESLESELTQTRDQFRRNEDKLCFLEESRSSLENKNEEMLKRIEEDSKNVVLIDDMSNQIQALMESEQFLKSTLKSLEEKNKDMESEIKEYTADKLRLEKELNELRQRLSGAQGDLERLRELDGEKSAMVELLTEETEKLKSVRMESKQKSADIEKLHKDIDLLEADLKENVENSKSVEKSLSHKIEELLQENAALAEKIKEMSETKENREENKPVKRKKSVTFRTDESAYIRDLKKEIHEYAEAMKKSEEEIARLKMELLRESLRHEVSEVVSEAKEKVESLMSTPEKTERKFDASAFFGNDSVPEENPFFDQQVDGLGAVSQDQNVDYDSLMWDDGWGTDGHLEEQYLSTQAVAPSQEKYDILEKELKTVEVEKQKIEEELQQLQGKYSKAIKKMKEQKAACEKLQSQVNRLKNDAEFGGLDGAMMDELKSQISAFEQREKELAKSLEASKAEKEALLKRIDVLNAGNEKLVEMTERQDEIDRWESKNRELLNEITELRRELRDKEEAATPVDENNLVRELQNKIEGLEWENCELKELLDEKQELLESKNVPVDAGKEEKLAKEVEELNVVKESLERRMAEEEKKSGEVIADLEQKISDLASENETLQDILKEMKKSEKTKMPDPVPVATATATATVTETETKVFDYFKSAPVNDVFSAVIAQPVYNQPVVEPVVERKVVPEAFASNETLERELESLKQENGLLQQQLSEAQSIITMIKTERHEMAEKYRAEYESALSFHLEEKNNALQKVYELEQALAIKIEELNVISTRMRDLDQAMNLKNEELEALSKGRQELEQAFGMKSEESSGFSMRIRELEQALVVKAEDLEKVRSRASELEAALMTKGDELNNAMRAVQNLEEKLRIREDEGFKILTELAAKAEEVSRLSLRIQELESECARKTASLESAQQLNENLLRKAKNSSEIESLSRSLNAERSAMEELQRLSNEKEEISIRQAEELRFLKEKLSEEEEKLKNVTQEYEKQRTLTEEYCDAKDKLEDLASNLQTELQTANMELELSRRDLEDLRKEKEEAISELERKMDRAESEEVAALTEEMHARTESYQKQLSDCNEEITKLQNASRKVEAHMEALKSELKEKDNDIFELSQTLDEEQKQLEEMRVLLEAKDSEIADLKHALDNFQEEISSFRNFEKQVKELRIAQMGSNAAVTAEGDPDFTNWTEHELAELNTRLQSDLDTALYMLHQRDIRCDELTFELMQLLEERDTLQLRLSTAIRINEELRSLSDKVTYVHDTRQENKDLVDQSNDRQEKKFSKIPEEDLEQLAKKISQLHSVGYIRDKTIQEETLRRHRDQMTLLGRVSETDLGRETQSPSSVTNWIRTGKTTPKVMHI